MIFPKSAWLTFRMWVRMNLIGFITRRLSVKRIKLSINLIRLTLFILIRKADKPEIMKTIEKVKAILRLKHWNQSKLAEHLGVSQSSVARWVSGVEPESKRAEEINALYRDEIGGDNVVPLVGYIGAGAEIMPDFEQIPPEGLDQIVIPFDLPAEMIAFEVRGASMLPVYKDGYVIVCYREQRKPLEYFYGEDAAVRTSDGRRFLKTVVKGDPITLMSFNAAPIEDVRLEWIGEIFAVLPRGTIKHTPVRRKISS
ncbi:XRE family transcriptional regulator [Rhizobium sp. Root651]|uniref:LexA family transcriptional regulator n=1 Tax=Rhizobium sp. Root651 TaxID=1736577 RepID=UPI00138F7BBA|nr:XRE family transcriptional regulator [Rhizobium sp. Root651]